MMFGKQYHYCPNCGSRLYDDSLSMKHVMSMMCSDACRDQWRVKYTRCILGKSDETPEVNQVSRCTGQGG